MPFGSQKTLLQMTQIALGELGLPQPSSVVGSSDQSTIQMFAFANQEVDELMGRHDWTFLQKEYNLAVTPPVTLTGTTTTNSATITNISSTTNLVANYMTVSASNIPVGARILTIDSPTAVTLNMQCTLGVVGGSIVFAQDTYPEPADFDRFINRTWWDRTNRWELLGPDSPQLDQWHRSGIIATGPRRHFRQLGALPNNYRLWPPPAEITSPIQLVFEYISNQIVFVNGAVSGNPPNMSFQFANDADIPACDSRAVIMGMKWRFWNQKGFDWTRMRADYDAYVERLISRDGGRETLQMAKRQNPIFISPANVQDGFFPGPVGPNTG